MGSPVSVVVANLVVEYVEEKALETFTGSVSFYEANPILLVWPNPTCQGQLCDRPGAIEGGSAGHGVLCRGNI